MAMELRPYQQEARDSIFEQWDSGIRRTLLVLPTGCGKTIVFAKVTEDCVYLLQPGKPHRYGADRKHPYEKIWINFFSEIFTEIFATYGLADQVVFPASGCRDLFEKLLELAQKSDSNDEVYLDVSGIVFEIALRLARSRKAKEKCDKVSKHSSYTFCNINTCQS